MDRIATFTGRQARALGLAISEFHGGNPNEDLSQYEEVLMIHDIGNEFVVVFLPTAHGPEHRGGPGFEVYVDPESLVVLRSHHVR